MSDVIVIGGGVIGLSVAWDLAGQGASVRVLEAGDFGGEASWAGAGILHPGNPAGAQTSEARLRAESAALWPDWSDRLRDATGIDNGYLNCGGLEVRQEGDSAELGETAEFWRREGVAIEPLSPAKLRDREPALAEGLSGYRLPGVSQVRNPRHLKALVSACAERGVELIAGQPAIDFEQRGGHIHSVETSSGSHRAGAFCVAGGAWSRTILERAGVELDVHPVRGQIVLLSLPRPIFRQVVEVGRRYLAPRPDGRVLIGSTEEQAGFEKRNTAEAVTGLLRFAIEMVPALADASLERTWAGLRPGSPDGLPFLGRAPGFENLFVAAGHFRAGLQLSPITGVVMRQVILGQETSVPLEAFSCERMKDEG